MNVVKSVSLASCLVLGMAVPALSQSTDNGSGSDLPRRGYVTANVGAASFASTTMATFAGEYGERLGRNAQAYANFSYFDNLMTDRMKDNLALAGSALTSITGITRSFSGRDRGLALTLGAKFVVPTNGAFRPYVGAGVGALNLRRTVIEQSLGDVSDSFASQSGLNDGVINSGSVSSTKPLTEIVAGVGITAGRAYIDVGYRFRKAFHTATPIDFSQVAVGIGMHF